MNYFALFSLPETLDIDKQQLGQTYQTLQQLTHPDKFSTGSEQEKRIAMQKNSQVNDGYSVLKHPLSRAQHLLAMRGVDIKDEQHTMQDPLFLMQQLEWREALEDAQNDEDALWEFHASVTRDIQSAYQSLATAFATDTDPQQLADDVRKLTFMYKFQEQVSQHLDKFED
ncbi:MAG: Fe-S protein assembly co-chaperone HscB [Glaciecola sp.]|jgi:molecular chaperone HscB